MPKMSLSNIFNKYGCLSNLRLIFIWFSMLTFYFVFVSFSIIYLTNHFMWFIENRYNSVFYVEWFRITKVRNKSTIFPAKSLMSLKARHTWSKTCICPLTVYSVQHIFNPYVYRNTLSKNVCLPLFYMTYTHFLTFVSIHWYFILHN